MPATDDLDVVRDLLTGKPPSQDVSDYVKGRLTAIIAAEEPRRDAQRPVRHGPRDATATGSRSWRRARRPWPARPLLLTGAASTALAAGLAVAVTITSGAARPPGGGTGPAFAPASTAAAVLRNAALAALAEPAAPPRPDQFVYSKLYAAQTSRPRKGVRVSPPPSKPRVQQAWISISGIRVGLFSQTGVPKAAGRGPGPWPACIHGRVTPRPAGSDHCTPGELAAYQPGMPTRPAALRTWLERSYRSWPDPSFHVRPGPAGLTPLLVITQNLLFTSYLTPAQHAAWYELLAQTPGLKAVPKASTLLGRTGVGVRWTFRTREGNVPLTTTYTMVFNRKTYQLLGMNEADTGGFTSGEALIKLAIVNKPGQLP